VARFATLEGAMRLGNFLRPDLAINANG
jgi:hypothetical protein